jgi:hypothetical protein
MTHRTRLSVETLDERALPSIVFDGEYFLSDYPLPDGTAAYSPHGQIPADFNGDGRSDYLTFEYTPSFGIGSVYTGRSDGTFEWQGSFYVGFPRLVAIGDFNADGRTDVGVVTYSDDYGEDMIDVYLNDGHWGPHLSVGNTSVAEGNAGTRAATFTVTLSDASAQTVAVDYATADGTATVSGDYQAASGTLIFAPGETGKTVTVLVNGDRIPESDEAFSLNLSNPTNADIASNGTGVILDDEPRLGITDATVTEGNSGQTAMMFTVSLSTVSDAPVSVQYATANDTAAADSDYQPASGTLTFAPGETSKTITVRVNGDRLAEQNETFAVNLSGATNASIGDSQGLGSIRDDEPRISIGNAVKHEGTAKGNSNKTTSFTFTVTLSAAYDQAVTLSFKTTDGSATTGDNDYVTKTGTLTFAPGETTKTITIEVKGDSKKEADETFYLDLFGNSSNSLFTMSRGFGTILNDD